MSEWSSGKEFGVRYLLIGFDSGESLFQQFLFELKRKKLVKVNNFHFKLKHERVV